MVMYRLNKNLLHLKSCVLYSSVLDYHSFCITYSSNKIPAFTFMPHLLHSVIRNAFWNIPSIIKKVSQGF